MTMIARALLRILGRRDLARSVAAMSFALVIFAHVANAYARPGGGNSYSGSSRSSGSSGSSGGDGEAIGMLLLLCFRHPALGIPVLLIVVAFFIVRSRMASTGALQGVEWTAGVNPAPTAESTSPRAELETLRRTDPAFSLVVFEDFVYFLYAEMHRARGARATASLATYLTEEAQKDLPNDGRIHEVTGIIIGALTYERVSVDASGGAELTVVVESNYVERYKPQGEQRFFARERLTLTRKAGARSRTPDKARILACPNCGAPLSAVRGNVCGHCRTQVDAGTRDWAVKRTEVLERDTRGPLLTSEVEERGTNLQTIVAPNARSVFGHIQGKDPEFTWQRLEQRIGLIFQEFHAGWVSREPSKVRPFVSDNLFQSQLYWIDLYRQNHCINRTDGAHITRVELAAATSDAYYDAVTVRLYASGFDYTIGEDGKLLSGNQKRPRAYSEYWTVIRGAQKRPTANGDKQCPNCGAPLAINMSGNCQYCGVKVTSGEYDWVLSRIEQDEAYTG